VLLHLPGTFNRKSALADTSHPQEGNQSAVLRYDPAFQLGQFLLSPIEETSIVSPQST
jgi:hypothetical protein